MPMTEDIRAAIQRPRPPLPLHVRRHTVCSESIVTVCAVCSVQCAVCINLCVSQLSARNLLQQCGLLLFGRVVRRRVAGVAERARVPRARLVGKVVIARLVAEYQTVARSWRPPTIEVGRIVELIAI
jgi:hypothetical protein